MVAESAVLAHILGDGQVLAVDFLVTADASEHKAGHKDYDADADNKYPYHKFFPDSPLSMHFCITLVHFSVPAIHNLSEPPVHDLDKFYDFCNVLDGLGRMYEFYVSRTGVFYSGEYDIEHAVFSGFYKYTAVALEQDFYSVGELVDRVVVEIGDNLVE